MSRLRLFAVLSALVLVASTADAQRRGDRPGDRRVVVRREAYSQPERELSLMFGALNYDLGDENFPMAAVRTDWRLSRWALGEMSLSYALGEVERPADTPGEDLDTSLLAATVGVLAELPIPYFRPYVGAAFGLFGRFDEEGGDSFLRPTHAFPVGLRIAISDRLALRGEARFRFDQHQDGRTATDVEQTVGVSFAF